MNNPWWRRSLVDLRLGPTDREGDHREEDRCHGANEEPRPEPPRLELTEGEKGREGSAVHQAANRDERDRIDPAQTVAVVGRRLDLRANEVRQREEREHASGHDPGGLELPADVANEGFVAPCQLHAPADRGEEETNDGKLKREPVRPFHYFLLSPLSGMRIALSSGQEVQMGYTIATIKPLVHIGVTLE